MRLSICSSSYSAYVVTVYRHQIVSFIADGASLISLDIEVSNYSFEHYCQLFSIEVYLVSYHVCCFCLTVVWLKFLCVHNVYIPYNREYGWEFIHF